MEGYMRVFINSLMVCALAFVPGWSVAVEDKVINVESEDSQMNAAIKQARNSVHSFLDAIKEKNGDGFAVKVPISEDGYTEHMWMSIVEVKNGKFIGHISNEPQTIRRVKNGQKYSVGLADISDWLYFHNEVAVGGYTIKVMLKHMSKEEAIEYRKYRIRSTNPVLPTALHRRRDELICQGLYASPTSAIRSRFQGSSASTSSTLFAFGNSART